MPMVVAGKVENSRARDIQRDIEIVGRLIKEMTGVGPLVAAGAVVGAAHVGPDADPLIRPTLPLAIGVETDRNDRRFFRPLPGIGADRLGDVRGAASVWATA